MSICFNTIKTGEYNAKVKNISEESGPFGGFLRFCFTISDGELKGWNFYGIVKPYLLKESKFYRWVVNISDSNPEILTDLSDLIGKHCRIYLDKKMKNSKIYYYVHDVLGHY